LTPFCDYYFTTYTLTSLFFGVEFVGISQYVDTANIPSSQVPLVIAVWTVLMFLATYSIRSVLTEFFVTQKGAEKTRDALTQTLDNLPDAVLMFEMENLSYCN